MKKRILALLCSVLAVSLMTVGMTSCDEDDGGDDGKIAEVFKNKTPEKAYNDALKALESVDNYEMTATQDIKMKMKVDGQSVDQNQEQTIKMKMNGDDQYVKVEGSAMEQETWYVDGVLYTISGDTKAKATMSLKDFQEQMMGATSNNILQIPEEWFKDVKFQTKDGKTYLTFNIDGNEYLELVGTLLDSLGTAADEMDLGTVEYTVYFDDDGNISKIVQDFSATFSIQGIEVKADYHTVTKVSIGTAGKITAPADGDSFIDVTDQMNSIG